MYFIVLRNFNSFIIEYLDSNRYALTTLIMSFIWLYDNVLNVISYRLRNYIINIWIIGTEVAIKVEKLYITY